jgi:hypothetical protein
MENPQEKNSAQEPALVINVQSWATPIAALLMLIVGLLGGYFGRPLITASRSTPTPTAEAVPTAISAAPASPNAEEMLQSVIAQTRHFRGAADAPVTIIEFGDFQ